MQLPLASLLVIPALASGALLAVAIPAGDAIDDSMPILLGAPAVMSAAATFSLGVRRKYSKGSAARWALLSAGAAVVWFGVLFVAGWALDEA